MVQSQFSVSWDSYNSNICKGFSALQQNGEFVDMTLAADGYYVKVHQVLIALASPFLKELISSAPCSHPVVFLNNVSHKTLSALLEYIYTGEVLVAADNLNSFTEAAKALSIKGLENFTSNDYFKMAGHSTLLEEGELCHVSGIKQLGVPVNQRVEQIGLPAAARKICIKQEPTATPIPKPVQRKTTTVMSVRDDSQDFDEPMDDITHDDTDENDQNETLFSDQKNSNVTTYKPESNLQFTVSIRGSLQIILNRYIYNMHSVTHRSSLRRWRCVDYRNNKCTAFVVTKGNVVLNRANLHNHSFHDKKILAKIEKKCVYSALDDVQGYNKEKDAEKTTEGQDFISLDDFSDIGDKSNDYIKET